MGSVRILQLNLRYFPSEVPGSVVLELDGLCFQARVPGLVLNYQRLAHLVCRMNIQLMVMAQTANMHGHSVLPFRA